MSIIDRSDKKSERLHNLVLFEHADRKALRHLAEAADEVSVPAGVELITEGHRHTEAFVIERGTAEVVLGGEVIAEIPEGEMVGEVGVFDSSPASATVRAKTDMELLVIPYNRIDAILDENPAMVRHIAAELAHRLRATDMRLRESTCEHCAPIHPVDDYTSTRSVILAHGLGSMLVDFDLIG